MKTLPSSRALALFFSLLGLSGAALADQPAEINFGVANVGVGGRPQIGGYWIAVAHAKGLLEEEFKKDGIKVNWNFFKTAGPGVNEALSNQLLDFAWQGDLPQIIAKANGLPTKFILATSRRSTFYVATTESSTAQSVKDLKDRKVAIFKGTCQQLTAARLLKDNGLTEKDLKVYNMDTNTSVSALASKDVEAVISGNNLFSVRDRGLAKILYNGKEHGGRYGCSTGLTVTEGFEAQYPEIVQRVVTTLVKVAQWTADPANATQFYQLSAKSGTPFQHFKQDLENYDLRKNQSPLIDEWFVESYKRSLADARSFGLLREGTDIDLNAWFETKYLDKALADLQIQGYWTPEKPDPANFWGADPAQAKNDAQ
jgi:sulfonate transport system substrate-binding protein